MPKRGADAKSDGRKGGDDAYNVWMFFRDFFSGVFSLLNSGKVFPAFGLLLLSIAGMVLWRMPESELAGIVRDLFAVIRSSTGVLMACLLASNIGWLWLLRRTKRIYQDEIDRLSEVRKQLMLGQDKSKFLTAHSTSNGRQKESYMIPARATQPNKQRT
ncbi:MAG: hypothetical protein KKD97_16450 [Gammaproteobacteria bacterium]|nr:hypothetical protein [Gammaproteobacteria bacterium]